MDPRDANAATHSWNGPGSSDDLNLSVEPAAIRSLTQPQKDRLTTLLDGYLRRLEEGLPPPREDILAANPDLAGPLQTYFQSLDELHDIAAGFQCPAREATADDAPTTDEQRTLGDFRLLREIGRGGMGVVYEARQISLGRRVAIKVLPFAAVLDSRQIARFKHEAQAAAQLEHPNIVSVFAIGVERGVHYYAMQFIDGQPLDRALAGLREKYGPATERPKNKFPVSEGDSPIFAERKLGQSPTYSTGPTPQGAASQRVSPPAGAASETAPLDSPTLATAPGRATSYSLLGSRAAGGTEYFRAVMRLGIQAAGALHAAHESGIVHRDIKPSNLLLDGNGKLWVADFGLARRQTDATLTRTGDLVGTIRYMSPEQAAGQVALIDHRTDIYSLGATLYELLTLEPAFPGDEGPTLLRRIERDEPRSPRQIQPRIPADLQTVVLKAMAKRREDRYATAQQFADDLQRVLDGRPTVARPPTLLDRAARWGLRHREVVAVAGLILLLAMLGLTASTLLIAREQQKTAANLALADKRFQEAQDAVECLGMRLSERLADVPGAAPIRQDLLRQTLGYYRGFVEQSQENPALRADLAWTYSKIGALSAEIGSSADAVDADRHAIELFQELTAASPRDAEYRRQLGVCQNNLGLVLQRIGQTDEARRAYAESIRVEEQALGDAKDAGQCRADLAKAHGNLGLLESATGDAQGAASSLARAVALQEELLGQSPDDPQRLRDLAVALNHLGGLYAQRQPASSLQHYEKAAALQKKAAELRPDSADYRCEWALTCNNLGAAQSRTGDVAQAAESYAKVVDLAGELARQSPLEKSYRHILAVGLNNLGLAESKLRRADAAERSLNQALALQEALVKQDPRDVEAQSALGAMYNDLGIVLEGLSRAADAVKAYQQAVTHQQQAVAAAPDVARYRQFLDKHYFNYSRILRKTGHAGDAARIASARRDLWPRAPQD